MIIEFIDCRIRRGAAHLGARLAAALVVLCCAAACSSGGSAAGHGAATVSPALLYDRSARQEATFTSPDHNVSCAFSRPAGSSTEGAVRCEIIVKVWQPPAKPSSCDVDWGFGVTLDAAAKILCAGDTIRGDAGSVRLPYGTAIRFSPLVCTSEQVGISCTNGQTGAGFLIGRQSYQLRNP